MDPKNIDVMIPTSSSVIPSDVHFQDNLDSIESKDEKYQACPMCKAEVRLFFVNFNEKILMCENTECDFPFGYEDVKFVTMNNEEEIQAEIKDMANKCSKPSPTPTCTVSEVDERSTICDSELRSQYDMNNVDNSLIDKRETSIKETLAIEQKVKEISMIDEMRQKRNKTIIKDENLIKNLMKIQKTSGFQLLDPSEMELVKIKEPKMEPQEFKINICSNSQNMFSIDLTIDAGETG